MIVKHSQEHRQFYTDFEGRRFAIPDQVVYDYMTYIEDKRGDQTPAYLLDKLIQADLRKREGPPSEPSTVDASLHPLIMQAPEPDHE